MTLLLTRGRSTGGGSALPAGYLAAEFLESTGTQGLDVSIGATESARYWASVQFTNASTLQAMGWFAGVYGWWGVKSGNFCIESVVSSFPNDVLKKNNVEFISKTKALENQGSWLIINNKIAIDKAPGPYGNTVNRASFFYVGSTFCFVKIFSGGCENMQTGYKCEFTPALDSQGVPCMFDKVTKQPFFNSRTGSFIVGFTLAQAKQLSKLSATGGTLTISLPTGYAADAGVANALETARSKGWTLTIQTYTPETSTEGASTFAIRRIWVRRTQNENGKYIDASGTRWQVDWCVDMLTPDGTTPDAHGYELFRSVDAAVAYWELAPWVDPEEEILTELEQ